MHLLDETANRHIPPNISETARPNFTKILALVGACMMVIKLT